MNTIVHHAALKGRVQVLARVLYQVATDTSPTTALSVLGTVR